MRYKLLTFGAAFMALTLSGVSQAQSTRCASITDHDERMVCNAVTSGRKTWCGFVKSPQKRAWCYVLLEKK